MPRRERGHQLNIELDVTGWGLWLVVRSKFPPEVPNFRLIEMVFEEYLAAHKPVEINFDPEPVIEPPKRHRNWQIKLW